MTKDKKIFIAKACCILGVIPALIYAHEYGPPAYSTTAPGDNSPTGCIQAACHVGTLNRAGGGNVQISPANGNTYVPGQTQKITIKITDSTQKSWGFQVTARLASNLKGSQAGNFASLDSSTQVICGDDSTISTRMPACSSAFPIQFAEQSTAGWSAARGTVGTYSFQVNWTAPSTNVGDVMFYATANASDGSVTPGAGHIYSATLTMSAASASPKPAITSSGGVVNGATFTGSSVAPNTYVTITGTNLSSTTRTWAGSDFGSSGTSLPTALDGTSVQINGKPAYVEFISPTQINVISPPDTAAGSGVPVTVTTGGQSSDVATVTLTSVSPGFFTFDGKYLAAADATTNAYIGKVGLFASAPNLTTPAKPGELITLYGTGFGPTAPAIATGIVTDKIYNLSTAPVINIGGTAATVAFAGLTPGFAQVYQFNVTIPANAPDGDLKIFAQTGGASSPNTDACCYITVKK